MRQGRHLRGLRLLTFCEVLEAYHGALTRFHFEAYVEFERVDNPHVPSLHPGFMEVLRSASKAMNEECGRHEQAHARYVLEAYPLLEERVHAWAWEWDPAVPDGHAPPYDEFLNGYMQVRGFMLSAAQAHAPWLLPKIEPLREHLAAQAAFAYVISERKIAALGASKEG